jgi:leader peptidase (prepilin peptidase)/N-methyltransferase
VAQLADLPLLVKLALLTLLAALVVSTVTDLRRRVILNVVTLPALALILLFYWLQGGLAFVMDSLTGLAVCFVPFFLASLPGWMGMGDAKLMAVVGAALGWQPSLLALAGVFIAGGVQAIAWLLAARLLGKERPKHVPYALAIAVGTAGAFFFGGAVV